LQEVIDMSHATFDATPGLQSPIEIRPDLVKVAGDVVVGLLLSRIVFCHQPKMLAKSKRHVVRDGASWIAKTREEWMAETGLTLTRYNRAIRVLKQKELIEMRVMMFQGVTMSHIRLLRDNLQEQLIRRAVNVS
jgi:hypothetical protein